MKCWTHRWVGRQVIKQRSATNLPETEKRILINIGGWSASISSSGQRLISFQNLGIRNLYRASCNKLNKKRRDTQGYCESMISFPSIGKYIIITEYLISHRRNRWMATNVNLFYIHRKRLPSLAGNKNDN